MSYSTKYRESRLAPYNHFAFSPSMHSIENLDLFDVRESCERITDGAFHLRGFALEQVPALLVAVARIEAAAPFRHLETPGGFRMSVAMTNCGTVGWVSDRHGYRYSTDDPLSGKPWPPMPSEFSTLAEKAARAAGFEEFNPDACLINRYEPGARLTLHQDKDENDYRAPIVSVSLGLPATFLFGGISRKDKQRRIALAHGDLAVWGGPARLFHHGILPLKDGHHSLLGRLRINLTFRRAASCRASTLKI
jgi:alkylated DNA repair protein (DNA oxidative demethylase)